DFRDITVTSVPACTRVADQSLGATILQAIEMTACWTKTNTNLGIVLLLAPLAKAATMGGGGDLRGALPRVLDETTGEDARDVYAAIRRASPGGLGRGETQDVAS